MSHPSRRWLEVRARSSESGAAHDLIAAGLVELGGRAVEELDGGWFVTHVEEPEDPERFLDLAAETLERFGVPGVELRIDWKDHEDWAETWKRGLEPVRIGRSFIVSPSWHEVSPGPDDRLLVVDPGMAFGTAQHGTTRGCLRLLEVGVSPGDRVLDVGSGSGILAIAAVQLGAETITAIEGDPLAVEALRENVARNGVSASVRCREVWADPDLLASLGPVDGVVANIESGVLRSLGSGFARALEAGGWLIVSGILHDEWQEVRDSFEGVGFSLKAMDEDGEWRSALFTLGLAG